jgi:heavy metal translocating P-type ATPase
MLDSNATAKRAQLDESRISSMKEEHMPHLQARDIEDKHEEHGTGEHEHSFDWRELSRVFFVAAAASVLWFFRSQPDAIVVIAGVICTLIGGFPIFHEAYENIVERRMTMELSMAIAIVAALAIREIFTALVITLFVLVAEILEGLTVGRGRKAIQRLVDLLPSTATVRRDGSWADVEIRQVAPNDEVLVRPGGRIPVDGKVVGGHSFVDQATITGESMPVEKHPGAVVYAGTINQSGAIEVRVERLGRDTTFGKIIEAVETAEKSRAPIQGIADRLAGYLVYFALGAAVLTFLISHNIRSTISVIIVAGACGIAAGTPLAILGSIGRAAQQGAIIKGGLYLEKLGEVDTVLLDKTGTLTYGTPELVDVSPARDVSATLLLKTAAIAESRSEHPIARAILRKAAQRGIAYEDPGQFEYTPGKGIIARTGGDEIMVGNQHFLIECGVQLNQKNGAGLGSEIFVARSGRFLGTLQVADTLRSEAKDAIQSLKSMRLRTVLLTGDAKSVAEDVGRKLGVDEIVSDLLPEDKLLYVKQLTEKGHKVAMVGDGVNDAPALMQASVGVAMGSGTDVARESADVVLIGSDLSKLVETLQTARRCRRTIMQNFAVHLWLTVLVLAWQLSDFSIHC